MTDNGYTMKNITQARDTWKSFTTDRNDSAFAYNRNHELEKELNHASR